MFKFGIRKANVQNLGLETQIKTIIKNKLNYVQ